MMHIRDVRVAMHQSLVPMGMSVGLAGGIIGRVLMLVMRVVDVRVQVLHRLVNMFMLVMLGEMEPHADGH
jgi:hypothetical protein